MEGCDARPAAGGRPPGRGRSGRSSRRSRSTGPSTRPRFESASAAGPVVVVRPRASTGAMRPVAVPSTWTVLEPWGRPRIGRGAAARACDAADGRRAGRRRRRQASRQAGAAHRSRRQAKVPAVRGSPGAWTGADNHQSRSTSSTFVPDRSAPSHPTMPIPATRSKDPRLEMPVTARRFRADFKAEDDEHGELRRGLRRRRRFLRLTVRAAHRPRLSLGRHRPGSH